MQLKFEKSKNMSLEEKKKVYCMSILKHIKILLH